MIGKAQKSDKESKDGCQSETLSPRQVAGREESIALKAVAPSYYGEDDETPKFLEESVRRWNGSNCRRLKSGWTSVRKATGMRRISCHCARSTCCTMTHRMVTEKHAAKSQVKIILQRLSTRRLGCGLDSTGRPKNILSYV